MNEYENENICRYSFPYVQPFMIKCNICILQTFGLHWMLHKFISQKIYSPSKIQRLVYILHKLCFTQNNIKIILAKI